MPAEAIHLSALEDSIQRSSARGFLAPGERRAEARLGALFVDLPYFDRFPRAVARYLLKLPVTASAWGDIFHWQAPVALGKRLLVAARGLRGARSSRESGERLLAIGLGYFSHLAVDAAIHPSVNRLARRRAARLGDRVLRQHNEVEKFQSILFHEERHGFDFMGRPFLASYIEAGAAPLLYRDAEIAGAVAQALRAVLGRAPSGEQFARWTKGYGQYGRLISSPLGKTIAPEPEKQAMRPEVYESEDGPFVERFRVAVLRSRAYLDAALAFAEDPTTEAALDRQVPEGSIDEPHYPSEEEP